jgi:hypothetical protein
MKYLKKFKAQRDKIQKQIQSKNTLENLKEFCDNLIADMSDYGITYYIDKDINGHSSLVICSTVSYKWLFF